MKLFSMPEVQSQFRKYKQDTGFSCSEMGTIIYYGCSTVSNWYAGNRTLSVDAYIALYALLEHEGYFPSCGIENYEDYINLQALEQIKQKHAQCAAQGDTNV